MNLRPARSHPGVKPLLATGEHIDLVTASENSEGGYSEIRGGSSVGLPGRGVQCSRLFHQGRCRTGCEVFRAIGGAA